jgi:predicted permease
VTFEIVGVAPQGLDYPRGTELRVTLAGSDPDGAGLTSSRYELDLIARLAPGSTRAEAEAAVDRLFAADASLSTLAADLRTTGVSFTDAIVGDLRPLLLATLAAGLVLLLVATANATLLFLAGGLRAGREMAIRRALGAGRSRAVGPLVADAALQAALGVAGGVALAVLGIGLLLPLAPLDFARFSTIRVDVAALSFAAALGSVALAGSAAVAGAWLARRAPASVLGGDHGSMEGGVLLRRAIAGGQVALAVTAAVAAVLLVGNLRDLERLDRGFDPEGLYVVTLRPPFDFFDVPAAYPPVLRRVSESLAARPGIQGVSPTFNAPLLLRGGIDFSPRVDDQTAEEAASNPYVGFDAVLPGYFDVAGTELLEGRGFASGDGPDDLPVVIVNQAAARALWPDRPAVGRRIFMGGLSREEWRTVVGVVENHRFRTFPEAHPSIWLPIAQYNRFAPTRLLVRATPAAGSIRQAVEQEFDAAYPGVDVVSVQALPEVMDGPLRRPRLAAATLLSLAIVTLLLAGLGVQGVLAVIVAERRRDLGIRIALGARARDVGRHLARHLLWIGAVGCAIGVAASVWGARLLGAHLYAGTPAPGAVVGVVCTVALLLVAVAGVPPLVRATRTDPVRALRTESSV